MNKITLNLMRIMIGFVFFEYGARKLFGIIGGTQDSGQAAELFSIIGVAGVLEFFGGIAILIGLFTRPVAFVLSGEMAAAYFIAHAPIAFWPAINKGDQAVVLCFVFLFLAFNGGGAWSVDGQLLNRGDKGKEHRSE